MSYFFYSKGPIIFALKPKTNPSLFKLAKIKEILEESIYADIRDYKKLIKKIKQSKANIIIHLAAQPLVRYSYLNPKETFETNILGTLNILEGVRKIKNIRSTIIITTDKVYDTSKNRSDTKDIDINIKDLYVDDTYDTFFHKKVFYKSKIKL